MMHRMTIKAPFPYMGGKSRAAPLIWQHLGNTDGYIEPFAGTLATLLGRPDAHRDAMGFFPVETVNDFSGDVSNFWRSVKHSPDAVAEAASNPVIECDLHARHLRLVNGRAELVARLEGDPEYHDAKLAGWWAWGAACWISGGWCAGDGPWMLDDGMMVKGNAGQGVNRKLPHLAGGRGVNRKISATTEGHLEAVKQWMRELADRLRFVRVANGDWSRLMAAPTMLRFGTCGVVLDPPYLNDGTDVYAHNSIGVAHDVVEWCKANGDNKKMRIALCGYEGDYEIQGWEAVPWKSGGGYQKERKQEVVWFSPHCLKASNTLFQ